MLANHLSNNNNLKDIRIREGLSMAELARLSNLSTTTIRKLEEDENYPPRPETKRKAVRGINENPNRTREYTYQEVFPDG